MFITAFHSKDNLFQDWHKKQVTLVKERLKAFPKLNELMRNFNGYENLRYKQSRNVIFVKCCQKGDGSDMDGYPGELERLESALAAFDIKSWGREVRQEFLKRLTRHDYFDSVSAAEEILTAYEIGKIVGWDKLWLHPRLKNGKKGDILVTVENRSVFIELTSIRHRPSEKKIESAFFAAAEHLGKKCEPENYGIRVHVNTALLPKDKAGRIDETSYAEYLKAWIDRMHLHELAGTSLYLDFRRDYSWIKDKKYLSELAGTRYEYSLQSEVAEMVRKDPKVAEWASKLELSMINRCPFAGVRYVAEYRGDLVEMHSDDFYPSPSSLARERAFHDQVARNIRDKAADKQYEEGFPIIFMIREEIGDKMFFDEDFQGRAMVDKVVEEELAKCPWLSGVLLYTNSFKDGRYLENKKADSSIKVGHDELIALGIL